MFYLYNVGKLWKQELNNRRGKKVNYDIVRNIRVCEKNPQNYVKSNKQKKPWILKNNEECFCKKKKRKKTPQKSEWVRKITAKKVKGLKGKENKFLKKEKKSE